MCVIPTKVGIQCLYFYLIKMKKIVLVARHGETFEGDVRDSTLTENERLHNEANEIILFYFKPNLVTTVV